MSDSLWPHGLQHARPPCPSLTPRVYSNLCPLSWWLVMPSNHLILCHPLLLPSSVFPSIRVFSNESVFCICQFFELWYWRRLLRVPWIAKRLNQSILKEINPDYSLEGLMLKLKLQYFGPLMWKANSLEKTLTLRKTEGRRRRGWQDKMVK